MNSSVTSRNNVIKKREQHGETDGILQNLVFGKRWLTFIGYFAIEELNRQYQRTVIGPFWLVLTQFVVVFAIAFVYSGVFSQQYENFFPFLSASIICWNLIANTLINAPNVFVINAMTMKSFAMPTSVFTAQLVTRILVQFAHALVVHALVVVMFKVPVNLNTLVFPVALALVLLWLYGMSVFLAIMGARFRDIIPAVSSFMYLAFLCTPVLWQPNLITGSRAFIVEANPFFYLLDILRSPLLGQQLHPNTLIVVCVLVLMSWVFAYFAARFVRRNAVFWV
jgi:ABC-type polysaccharide/polyol phosphate export permease